MPALREEEVHRIRKRLEERRKSQVEISVTETSAETGSRRALQEIDPHAATELQNDAISAPTSEDVTYRVYRLADLDRRRASLASAPVAVIEPTNLERISRAAADSMNVAVAWTKGDRSSGFIETLRPSLTTLIASMRLLNGRLLARRAAIVITSAMFLVGAILILAEVTDDVRPVQPRASTSITNVVLAAKAQEPPPAPLATNTPPPPPKVEARTQEIDLAGAPPPSPPKKTTKKTAKRAPEVEIFLP